MEELICVFLLKKEYISDMEGKEQSPVDNHQQTTCSLIPFAFEIQTTNRCTQMDHLLYLVEKLQEILSNTFMEFAFARLPALRTSVFSSEKWEQ